MALLEAVGPVEHSWQPDVLTLSDLIEMLTRLRASI